MQPAWQWDEFRQVGTDYESVEEVAAYDARMRQFRDVNRETDEFLRLLDLPPNGALLEIGTGTGALARKAAAQCTRVTAIDISRAMLDYASKRAAEENLNNIEFIQAGFLSYEGQPENFDAVVTGMAMHHLPDLWKMAALLRINRYLKPGGAFCLHDVVFAPPPEDFNPYFDRAVEFRLGASQSNFVRHVKQEYSTLDWIMEGLLERTGFKIIDKIAGQPDWVTIYNCRLARKIQ